MPKFTTPENLYFQIDKQSVGPYTEGNEANEILRVFQPEQGIDVLYRNPLTNNDSTEIIEDFNLVVISGETFLSIFCRFFKIFD